MWVKGTVKTTLEEMVNIKYYNEQNKIETSWIGKDSEFLAQKDGMKRYWSVLTTKKISQRAKNLKNNMRKVIVTR